MTRLTLSTPSITLKTVTITVKVDGKVVGTVDRGYRGNFGHKYDYHFAGDIYSSLPALRTHLARTFL
jgi:hypothetical protein